MLNKEFIQEQIKKIEITLKDNENVFSKEMKSLYEDDLKHYNQILKDLDRLKQIDNAKPSKALELVGCLQDYFSNMMPYQDWLKEIENYILKAQQIERR